MPEIAGGQGLPDEMWSVFAGQAVAVCGGESPSGENKRRARDFGRAFLPCAASAEGYGAVNCANRSATARSARARTLLRLAKTFWPLRR